MPTDAVCRTSSGRTRAGTPCRPRSTRAPRPSASIAPAPASSLWISNAASRAQAQHRGEQRSVVGGVEVALRRLVQRDLRHRLEVEDEIEALAVLFGGALEIDRGGGAAGAHTVAMAGAFGEVDL